MEDVETWIKECEGKTFIDAMGVITMKIYDTLEYKKSKSDKITGPLVQGIKKALDFIMKECNRLNTDNAIMKARLEDRKDYIAMMTELAEKVTRASVGSMDEVQQKVTPVTQRVQPRRDDYAVIVTSKEESQDVDEMKKTIKSLCKEKEDFPTPTDVVVTKARQVIMRYKNKKDLEDARDKMKEAETVNGVAKINIPIRRRERLLVVSVDPVVTEDDVKKALELQISESGIEDVYTGLTDRLESSIIDQGTKLLLEGLLKKPTRNVRIVRKIETRMGKHNWLIDVDQDSRKALLEARRICIDFERYRIVEFVSIMRCYRCQKFGHFSSSCDGEQHCPKCAGDHQLKDCKSEQTSCSNCYFEDMTADCNHRADSTSCPAFLKYRESLIPKRS